MPQPRWIPAAMCMAFLLAPAAVLAIEPPPPLRADWKASPAFRDGVLEGPAYRAIEEHYPADYARIEAVLGQLVNQGATAQQTVVVLRAEVQAVMLRSAAAASDESVTKMTRNIVDVIAVVGDQDAGACGALLFGDGSSGIDYLARMPAALAEDLQLSTADVIRSSHVAPRPAPRDEDIMDDLTTVMTPIVEKYGDQIDRLGAPDATPAERATSCNITLDIYRGVLKLPTERSGPVLRFMYGSDEATSPEAN